MKRIPIINSIKNTLLPSVITLVCAILLVISIRGLPGNPSSNELNATKWTENGPFELSPERGRFALLYSLLEDHSYFFSVPLAEFAMPDLGYKNKNFVSLFAPGISYIAIPGYLLGKYFGASQVGAFATASVFAVINILLIYAIAKKMGAHTVAALISMIVFLFATPAYAYGVSLYQHHISTFLILMCLYLYISFNSLWATSVIWFLCASAIPIDYPNLFLMFPLGIASLVKLFSLHNVRNMVTAKISIYAPLTFLSVILPLGFFLWFNTMSYANPFQFSGTVSSAKSYHFPPNTRLNPTALSDAEIAKPTSKEKNAVAFFTSRGLLNGLYILLFSPDRGIIMFTPIVFLGILGSFIAFRKHASTTALIWAVIISNILFYAMYGDVWGGWAFGSRYLIPTYALLSLFLAFALSKWKKNVLFLPIFLVLVSYSVIVNTAGALSSSANPPKVQVLELEKLSGIEQKYTPMRNIDSLKNRSKSFVYQTLFKPHITSWQFYQYISGAIIGMIVLLSIALILTKKEELL